MSLDVDHKYINILSSQLNRFARKSRDLYNFRCPFCGDSSKNKFKARGYFFLKNQSFFYKCHNCSIGYSLPSFIKEIDNHLFKQYSLEKFSKPKSPVESKYPYIRKNTMVFKDVKAIQTLASLEDNHPAKRFMIMRKLPLHHLHNLYYTDDFREWVYTQNPNLQINLRENDPRIVIPFFDTNKNMFACQGRTMDKNNQLRYITVRFEANTPKIFGLERWKDFEKTYIFEGPIDSLFVPNSLAIAGSDLSDLKQFKQKDVVFCYDNEPRNKQIIEKMLRLIDQEFKVVVWPSSNKFKDINDMIVGGYDQNSLLDMINKHTFTGLRARIQLNSWKRI